MHLSIRIMSNQAGCRIPSFKLHPLLIDNNVKAQEERTFLLLALTLKCNCLEMFTCRSYLCQDLLQCIGGGAEALFRSFWTLKDSIVCCAWKVIFPKTKQNSFVLLISVFCLMMVMVIMIWLQPLPEFIFANQAALDMLETNPTALRGLSLDQMFNDGSSKTDYSQPPPFILKEVS